jgi:hypothetical protein
MDSGFFRLLDARRYMELDGITAKHLYRFLAVAFEKSDLVLMDARQLCREHLGILNPPKYLSRLMQTLEPAFEQLIRIQVLGSFHIVSSEQWRIALHRHTNYVPGRKTLALYGAGNDPEASRAFCEKLLQDAGFSQNATMTYCAGATTLRDFHSLERAARLLVALMEEEVLPHVAISLVRNALDLGPATPEGREVLDGCEIALEVCRQKKRSGQALKNAAGLLIKIIKDPSARSRIVPQDIERTLRESFRRREQFAERQQHELEEQALILEFEQVRESMAEAIFNDLADAKKARLRKEKADQLRQQERFQRLAPALQQAEIDAAIRQEIAKNELPPYEKWRLRKQAQQAVLPFIEPVQESA